MRTRDARPGGNDPDAHAGIRLLLPWYVNGTLGGAEAEAVRQHLGVCLRCRAEYRAQQRLARAIRADDIGDLAAQLAFERLRARIGRREHSGDAVWRRLRADLPGLVARMRASQAALFGAFGGAAVLSACLAVLLALPGAGTGRPEQADFAVLGTSAGGASGANTLWVRFDDGVPQARIESILAGVGGQARTIAPSPPLYAITLADASVQDSRVDAALHRLQATEGVAYAVRAGGAPRGARDD